MCLSKKKPKNQRHDVCGCGAVRQNSAHHLARKEGTGLVQQLSSVTFNRLHPSIKHKESLGNRGILKGEALHRSRMTSLEESHLHRQTTHVNRLRALETQTYDLTLTLLPGRFTRLSICIIGRWRYKARSIFGRSTGAS